MTGRMDRHDSDRARPLRVRFAPSPGVSLHAAGARIALFNWLVARRTGGAFVVRIEGAGDGSDVHGEAAILRDLRWLGLDVDEGPDAGGAFGPYRQSERGGLYREHVDRLLASGSAYERDGAVWFRMPPGSTVVHDGVKGEIVFDHATIADFVIRKAGGTVSSNLATAVDDATMHIDLVLRGDEHLDGTPRQIALARALGYEPPAYAHAGALLDDHKRVLAKDDEATGIQRLRSAGFLPEAVVEHVAHLGWSPPDARPARTLDELVPLFSLARVGHSPSVFDLERLRAFNARTLRALPRERFSALLAEIMQRHRLLEDPVPDAARRWIDTFLDAFGDDVHTLGEALEAIAKLREESVTIPALELERLRNRQVLFFLDAVSQYVDDQPELRGLPLGDDLPAIAHEFGIARADAFGAVRMALTGTHDGPPLTLLFPLLGHDRIMIRIGAISSHILHGRGLEPIRYGPGGVPFETIHAERPDASEAAGQDANGS